MSNFTASGADGWDCGGDDGKGGNGGNDGGLTERVRLGGGESANGGIDDVVGETTGFANWSEANESKIEILTRTYADINSYVTTEQRPLDFSTQSVEVAVQER